MKIDIDYIKQVADVMEDKALAEINIEDGEKKISLKRAECGTISQVVMPQVAPVAQPQQAIEEPSTPAKKATPITSPMVGTFYAASSPDADPYVKEGDIIRPGQVVCIIEAMKLMNEIEADVSGKIVEICVENGQTIEFGQVLMYVE